MLSKCIRICLFVILLLLNSGMCIECSVGVKEKSQKVFFQKRLIVCKLLEKLYKSLMPVFRSRKKFSTTYAIVLFFLFFFSPDLFMKISNFSKTVHTIFTKFCTVILHPKGPLRVQRHQNRMAWM